MLAQFDLFYLLPMVVLLPEDGNVSVVGIIVVVSGKINKFIMHYLSYLIYYLYNFHMILGLSVIE